MDPMMTPPAQAAQPGAQDPGAGAPDSDQGGYTIEIEVSGAGKITVSVETSDQEDTEGGGAAAAGAPGAPDAAGGGAEAEDGDRPVANIKEALTLALEIFRADGKMPNDGGDADFNSGFTNRTPQ